MDSESSQHLMLKNKGYNLSTSINGPRATAIVLPPVNTRVNIKSRSKTYIAIALVIFSILLVGVLTYILFPSGNRPASFQATTTRTNFQMTTLRTFQNQRKTTYGFGGTKFDLTTKELDSQLDMECGIVSTRKILPKIINGIESRPHSWPWAVAIFLKIPIFGRNFSCGGSLISSRWVLTAAHCLLKLEPASSILGSWTFTYFLEPEAFHIAVGLHNLAANIPSNNLIKVKRVIPHPNFYKSTASNDIALIELMTEVPRSEEVQYLCLNQHVEPKVGEVVQAIGWGSTSISGDDASYVLNQVSIRILDDKMCKSTNYNQICAGNPTGNSKTVQDTCAGDSGGPIMVKRQDKWTAVGVVSHGANEECNGIGVYTRVSYYLNWIIQKIKS